LAITTPVEQGKTSEEQEPIDPPTPGETHAYIRVWDLEKPGKPLVLGGHWRTVRAIRITPDGNRAVSASQGWVLRIWDLMDGKHLHVLRGHQGIIHDLAITADSRYVVSVSDDRTLRVWDLETGNAIATWTGEMAAISCAVSPDGRYMVVGEKQGRVHLLSLEGVTEL